MNALQAIIDAGLKGWQELKARGCLVILEPRPEYCDRGHFLAKLFPTGFLDNCEGWARYYFSEERAKAEIAAWLEFRGLVLEGEQWSTKGAVAGGEWDAYFDQVRTK